MPTYRLERPSVQYHYNLSRAKIQIFGGGFGNGKTTALVMKALQLSQAYPGSNGLLARSTYPKLNDTLRKEFFKWCPRDWIARMPTKDDNTCVLINKTVVNFRYVSQRGKTSEDGSTTSNLLSTNYDWIGIDQIEDPEITHKDFLDLAGRLRGDAPYRPDTDDPSMPKSGPRWLMVTCNPTHNWFYREVVQPYMLWKTRHIVSDKLMVDEKTKLPIVELYEGSTYTNSANLAPDYIATLEAMYKGQMRERFLLGKWAAFEGLVHPDFDPLVHGITREQAYAHLEDCKRRHVRIIPIEGYDFGLVSPSCYLAGFVDDYSRVILLDGFYEANYSYTEQPAAISEIRSEFMGMLNFRDTRILADPDIFRTKVISGRPTGETIEKLLRTDSIQFKPGQNDVIPGIAKVNSYLAGHPEVPHLVTGKTPGPLIYVPEHMQYLFDEFAGYFWKRNPQGQRIDEPIDSNDHAMNTIKYMLSNRPEASKIEIPKNKLPPQWRFWHEVEESAGTQ